MRMLYRKLTKNDFNLICNWHKNHIKINFPDSQYKRQLFLDKVEYDMEADDAELFILNASCESCQRCNKKCAHRKDVGFLWLKILYDPYKEYDYCDLHYIHLAPEFRGKGYGKAMLKYADNWAKNKEAKEIRLGTSADNEKAIKIYEKAGYKLKRVLMEKKYD